MSSLHRTIGLLAVAAFIGTGIYMRVTFPGLYGDDEALHYRYRANHVYIMVAGLINLAISLAAPGIADGWRGRARRTGSVLLLMAPAVLLAAFFIDPPRAPDRWLTSGGMLALGIGVFAHLTASRRPAGPKGHRPGPG